MKARYILVGFVLVVTGWPAWADLSLDQAIRTALGYSAEIKAREANYRSDQAAEQAAGTLPDPRLYSGVSNIPVSSMGGVNALSTGQDPMSMRVVGISQDLPNPAKRHAEHAQVEATVDQDAVNVAKARVDLRVQTAQAWIQRYYTEQRFSILKEQQDDDRLLITLVDHQVAAGRRPATDAIDARLDGSEINNQLDQTQGDLRSRIAQLVRLVGDRGREPLLGKIPLWPVQRDNLYQQLSHHPDLMLAQATLKSAEAGVASAEADRHPDWGMDLAYQHRGPSYADMVSLTVSMSLPVFQGSRQGPRVMAQQERLTDARDTLLDMQREHAATLDSDISTWQGLNDQVQRLQQESLPWVQKKIGLMVANYQAGSVEIDNLLAARAQRRRLLLQSINLREQRDTLAARLHFQCDTMEVQP
ncbi:MAG: TolC family protein [Pseudomonadales bacterium]|nr:TolC family protein [Pseudomonadales bacterium]